jgi:hypothetical protein
MLNYQAFLTTLYNIGMGALLGPSFIGKKETQFWYVDGTNGNDAGKGSLDSPFQTFAPFEYDSANATSILHNGDVIVMSGVVRDQFTAPQDVFDVTIIGAANQPRQATDSGTPTGGGATWLAPTSPTAATPLLTLREQAWKIVNILFGAETDAACIKLHRTEVAAAMDASHVQILGCYFVAGDIGVEDYGGCSNVRIEGCTFYNLTNAIEVTNQGIAIPNKWLVKDNRILGDSITNGIVGAWVESQFMHNVINKCDTTTINAASGNTGLRNVFFGNIFNIAAADFDPAGGVTGNATDYWYSFLSDDVEFGVPAN